MRRATFATLSALLLVARVGPGCGGTTRAAEGGSDAGSTADVDSASPVDAQSQVQQDTGSPVGADAAQATDAQDDGEGSTSESGASSDLDAGMDVDANSCVLLDGAHGTCGGPWRCCREGAINVGVEVVCVALDASCPVPPP